MMHTAPPLHHLFELFMDFYATTLSFAYYLSHRSFFYPICCHSFPVLLFPLTPHLMGWLPLPELGSAGGLLLLKLKAYSIKLLSA